MNEVLAHGVVRLYSVAGDCDHPEPADDTAAEWADWEDDHPYGMEGQRLCVVTPPMGSGCPACTEAVADVEDLPEGEYVACRVGVTTCPLCRGYCTNGAECAVSQLVGKRQDWRSGTPVDIEPDPETTP